MLKIYNKKYNKNASVKSISVYNNTLYMLNTIYEDYDLNIDEYLGYDLMKIDLNKRDEISTKSIHICSGFMIDKYIYDLSNVTGKENSKINIIDADTFNKVDEKHLDNDYFLNIPTNRLEEITISNVCKINNEIHYIIEIAIYVNNLNLTINSKKYIIKNLNTNEILYTIILMSRELVITDEIIYLPFNNCNIMNYQNTLVLFDQNGRRYLKFNIITKEYEIIYINTIYPEDSGYHHINYLDDSNILIEEYDTNKVVVIDLKNDTYEAFNFDKEYHSEKMYRFNGKQYYIFMADRSLYSGIKSPMKEDNLDIYVRKNDYFKFIDPKRIDENVLVTIGTDDENVKIPLDLLKERSNFIRSIYEDIKIDKENSKLYELISDNYKNITMYKNYIENDYFSDDIIYDLYKICNYLQDTNINYLAEMIIIYVRDNNLTLKEAFEYLDLLHSSTCDEQLEVLLYVIYDKYDKNLFHEMISDKTLLLNNYIRKSLKLPFM